ncbi:hypothetical protein KQI65_09925 [bacterium]|nr:hypothetical protein [bacterium]
MAYQLDQYYDFTFGSLGAQRIKVTLCDSSKADADHFVFAQEHTKSATKSFKARIHGSGADADYSLVNDGKCCFTPPPCTATTTPDGEIISAPIEILADDQWVFVEVPPGDGGDETKVTLHLYFRMANEPIDPCDPDAGTPPDETGDGPAVFVTSIPIGEDKKLKQKKVKVLWPADTAK